MSKNSCKISRWQQLKTVLNNLDATTFKQKLEVGNAILIDVRTSDEFAAGHIEGAIHLDYFGDDFLEQLEALDTSKNILVYCRSGRRSIRVCTLLKNSSFEEDTIFNLNGGILEWLETFDGY